MGEGRLTSSKGEGERKVEEVTGGKSSCITATTGVKNVGSVNSFQPQIKSCVHVHAG